MISVLDVLFLHPRKFSSFEASLVTLAERMRRDGDRLTLLFPSEPCPEAAARFRDAGARVVVLPFWAAEEERLRQDQRVLVSFVMRLALRERFDVVDFHFCGEVAVFLVALCLRLAGRRCRFVWHQMSEVPAAAGFLRRRFSRIRLVSLLAHVVVQSRKARANLLTRRVAPGRVSVIPLGVPDPGPAVHDAGKSGRRAIVSVAQLIPRKGLHVLLPAFASTCRAAPGTTLTIAGEGPEEENLKRLARSLGVGDAVRFAGFTRDVPGLLRSADVFALASIADPGPLVVIEALAAGLPVVASRTEGLPEMVEDGVNGFLVPPGDADALAAALAALMGDPALRARMGSAGRKRFLERFSMERNVEANAALYRESSGPGRGAAC